MKWMAFLLLAVSFCSAAAEEQGEPEGSWDLELQAGKPRWLPDSRPTVLRMSPRTGKAAIEAGEIIRLELPADGSDEAEWAVADMDPNVIACEASGISGSRSSGHMTYLFSVRGLRPGKTQLVMEYRNPREKSAASKTFAVNVTVTPQVVRAVPNPAQAAIPVGERFRIELPSPESPDYEWVVAEMDPAVVSCEAAGIVQDRGTGLKTHAFSVLGIGPGATRIVLEYRHTADKTLVRRTFAVKVRITQST